jgi:thiamine-phosphate pyrophosphorylase
MANRALRGVYPLIDTDQLSARSIPVLDFARAVISAKPALVQLRAKSLPAQDLRALAREMMHMCSSHGVPFVLNDFPDVAAELGAEFVHLGQGDEDPARVRSRHPGLRIGLSTHNQSQCGSALETGCDYVAIGPIFATASKKNHEPAIGMDELARISQAARKRMAGTRIPLVAIGGIREEQLSELAPHVDLIASAALMGSQSRDLSHVVREWLWPEEG